MDENAFQVRLATEGSFSGAIRAWKRLSKEIRVNARILLMLPVVAGLAACSQPFEGRIARNLEEAGLSRGMSECMANRWVERLSPGQLRKIADLAAGLKAEGRSVSLLGLADRVRRLEDPEIVEVVSTSAAGCAFNP